MFRPTKAFKDYVTGHKDEPSLRIGKRVPKDAVNLAYYYNPTATDAEKVLAADPPRSTIDHRIATQWVTKLDVASGPNGEEPPIDTFPETIGYHDQEGYVGTLYRQDNTVNWYGETHENQKSKTFENQQIVTRKGDEDQMIEYSDANGYRGYLTLDTVEYTVDATKDVSVTEELDYTINNFELDYHTIFGSYLSRQEMNDGEFMNVPNAIYGQDYCWPARIELTATKLRCSDGTRPATDTNNRIANYINNLDNNFEGENETPPNSNNVIYTSKPIGYLYFDHLEYEPGADYNQNPKNGSRIEGELPELTSDTFAWEAEAWNQDTWEDYGYRNIYPDWSKTKIDGNTIQAAYMADMSLENGYEDIEYITNLLANKTDYNETQDSYKIQEAINNGHDIVIYLDKCTFHVGDEEIDMLVTRTGEAEPDEEDDHNPEDVINTNVDKSNCYYTFQFKYIIADKGIIGESMMNIIAVYHSVTNENGCSVKRKLVTKKEEATRYVANCTYVGIVDKNWIDYDGIAFYMGSVSKGNAIGNQNADGDNELLMYPDKDGYLRQIVEVLETETDENNRYTYEMKYKDYYRVEADTVYITNVFKDNVPCFYKYRLKTPIYDYRGPDENGFYRGDAVQIYSSNMKKVPERYKHNMRLVVADTETVTSYDEFNNPIEIEKPKCYLAELYTSFISSSTDTFKVVYNGFDDIDDNNKVMESGIEEDIYNAPFMINGVDYAMRLVDSRARLNMIQLLNYTPIEDTRKRITFTWYITATDEETGEEFTSETRQSSILNKDYTLPCEDFNFIDRAMIISPKLGANPIPCTPFELCLEDQSSAQAAWTKEHNKQLAMADDDELPELSEEEFHVIVWSGRKLTYKAHIDQIRSDGAVNISCNPDGTGMITAETTVDTGFYNEAKASYTKKLDLQNPYWTDGKYIYEGYKVKCIDSRNIKVKAPREDGLLDSWYPMIQFGHYTRIFDQYGAHTKICYTMPEYDQQHYSEVFGRPYVDITKEKVTVLNPHMVKTKGYPLHVLDPAIDNSTYFYKNKYYKVIKDDIQDWTEASLACKKMGGHLVIPKNQDENDFILKIAKKNGLQNIWLGIKEDIPIDGTINVFDNNIEDREYEEDEIYTKMYISDGQEEEEHPDDVGKWFKANETDLDGINGYICEITGLIKLYKRVEDEIFDLTIKNVSYSDGIIIIEEAVSETDDIIADYTYLEEHYIYRGYWRNENDFVRIDLNPNIYHTYNNPDYYPSATSPSKNLFNKVIYFFMKPNIEYEIPEIENGRFVYDPADDKVYELTYEEKTVKIGEETVKVGETEPEYLGQKKVGEKEVVVGQKAPEVIGQELDHIETVVVGQTEPEIIDRVKVGEEQIITGYTTPVFLRKEKVGQRPTGEYNTWTEVIPPDISNLTPEQQQEMRDNPVSYVWRSDRNTYDFEKVWGGNIIKTTYGNNGFISYIKANEIEDTTLTSVDTNVTNGLNIKINNNQLYEGLIQMEYEISNTSSDKTFHNIVVAAGGDIMIANDDTATVQPIKDGNKVIGIKMLSTKEEDKLNGVTPGFAFVAPDFNIAYGFFSDCRSIKNALYLPNPIEVTHQSDWRTDGDLVGVDSGLCFNINIGDLAPGRTRKVMCYFGIYMSSIDYNVRTIEHSDPIYEDVYKDIYSDPEPIYETVDIMEDVWSEPEDIIEEREVYRDVYSEPEDIIEVQDIMEDIYSEPEPIYETRDITKDITVEHRKEITQLNVLKQNTACLYHKINDSEPDDDIDIMVGSVYIRANTSLHSTVVTDSRTRGGGILKEISDSLRKELEPESDFYLDIGYYDGEPYQENGVIVVRLDNKLLKDFGGRFTMGDIEQKVKRWLGVGVYPIIEFVDSYKKTDLPQYTIEVEDSYQNVVDIIPEISLDCVEI